MRENPSDYIIYTKTTDSKKLEKTIGAVAAENREEGGKRNKIK